MQGLNTGIIYDVKDSMQKDWEKEAAINYNYDIAKMEKKAKLDKDLADNDYNN
jgi:hypothetical protein